MGFIGGDGLVDFTPGIFERKGAVVRDLDVAAESWKVLEQLVLR
eukprot:CAMPEP_0182808840 /NCGR_PEP_ID=MMETSP0006_2-20121128/6863_1 /TAXON_ID=97485 /ORGANISM="Prymnesium parvum, Strain Texoma1" /LENGTH=43 /DNA_ID= /DNA_START= /DNA_END= /DNA_ORIENTATION=